MEITDNTEQDPEVGEQPPAYEIAVVYTDNAEDLPYRITIDNTTLETIAKEMGLPPGEKITIIIEDMPRDENSLIDPREAITNWNEISDLPKLILRQIPSYSTIGAAGLYDRNTNTTTIFLGQFLNSAIELLLEIYGDLGNTIGVDELLDNTDIPATEAGHDSAKRVVELLSTTQKRYLEGSLSRERRDRYLQAYFDWYISKSNIGSVLIHELKHQVDFTNGNPLIRERTVKFLFDSSAILYVCFIASSLIYTFLGKETLTEALKGGDLNSTESFSVALPIFLSFFHLSFHILWRNTVFYYLLSPLEWSARGAQMAFFNNPNAREMAAIERTPNAINSIAEQ